MAPVTSASNGIERDEAQPGGRFCASGTALSRGGGFWADSHGIPWTSIGHGVTFRILLTTGQQFSVTVPRETETARRNRLVDVDELERGSFRVP
jgi:hypothetical protein